MENQRLNRKIILKAIYKHYALSVKQLSILLDAPETTIGQLIVRYKKENLVDVLKTIKGVFYFITSSGAHFLDMQRAYKITSINELHTTYEIKTLRYLVEQKKIIKPTTLDEFLDSYLTEREIKKIKFEELGAKALKLRWVDLMVGKQCFEIEITKKERKRYKQIVTKLDEQAEKEKWESIVWIVYSKDVKWMTNVLQETKPETNTTIWKIENLERKEI